MPNFLDYALSEAKKTQFDVQTLGGLKQYLSGFIQTKEHHAAAGEAKKARQAYELEEGRRIAYSSFRRASALSVFATLPVSERQVIEGLAGCQRRPVGLTTDGPLAATAAAMVPTRTRLFALQSPPRAIGNPSVFAPSFTLLPRLRPKDSILRNPSAAVLDRQAAIL